MNVNPVTTSFSYKAASALTGTTCLVFACSFTLSTLTILVNLVAVIFNKLGCLDKAIKHGLLRDRAPGHLFINRHMGAFIATASISLALWVIASSALDYLKRTSTVTQ